MNSQPNDIFYKVALPIPFSTSFFVLFFLLRRHDLSSLVQNKGSTTPEGGFMFERLAHGDNIHYLNLDCKLIYIQITSRNHVGLYA
tara:strand:+ start:877 stop:1134 length:258 start_codon:yes stop_codon:yes gene_type:complete